MWAFPSDAGHRHAGGDRLGHDQQIGLDPEVLDGEELPGAAEPGLHLVDDEHDPVLRRELADSVHPLGGGHHESALALDGLEDDRGHVLCGDVRRQHPPQRVERLSGRVGARPPVRVGERRAVDLGGERAHPGLVRMLLRRERHRHQRAAVERAVEGDHRLASRGVPGDLDGVLDSLGAGVEERGLLGARDRRPLEQPLGELDVGLVRQDREVGVEEAVDLGMQGRRHARVRVADVQAADAARPVEERVAVDVGDRAAGAPIDHHGRDEALRRGDDTLLARDDRARIRPRDLGAQLDGHPHITNTPMLEENEHRHYQQQPVDSAGWCCLTGRSARRSRRGES